jgi:hypothetical protein
MSIRAIAVAADLSNATVCRMLNEPHTSFDFENIAKLANWLGRPLTESGAIVKYESDILAAICRVIRTDPKLDLRAAEWLCNLMTDAYKTFARNANGGVRPSENRGA